MAPAALETSFASASNRSARLPVYEAERPARETTQSRATDEQRARSLQQGFGARKLGVGHGPAGQRRQRPERRLLSRKHFELVDSRSRNAEGHRQDDNRQCAGWRQAIQWTAVVMAELEGGAANRPSHHTTATRMTIGMYACASLSHPARSRIDSGAHDTRTRRPLARPERSVRAQPASQDARVVRSAPRPAPVAENYCGATASGHQTRRLSTGPGQARGPSKNQGGGRRSRYST